MDIVVPIVAIVLAVMNAPCRIAQRILHDQQG